MQLNAPLRNCSRFCAAPRNLCRVLLASCCLFCLIFTQVHAQSFTGTNSLERRLARARALAAAHNLAAAVAELNTIRNAAAANDAMRAVACIILMNIYLEEAKYVRAATLLKETYNERAARKESSAGVYFALAGQVVNGARLRLQRYRDFGINVTDAGLPLEAVTDLDHLRRLLEQVVGQASLMSNEALVSTDVAALLEDAASVRLTLARDGREREKWQSELSNARQKLVAAETNIATYRRAPTAILAPVAKQESAKAAEHAASTISAASSGGDVKVTNAPALRAAKSDGALAVTAMNVGSLVDKATKKVEPVYPLAAKNAGVAGIVIVFVEVNEAGEVAAIERASGPQMLRQPAIDAARQWRFHPTMINGKPARVTGFINFNFTWLH
jgi:TonB family protein